jgi:hypothetical protein
MTELDASVQSAPLGFAALNPTYRVGAVVVD